MALNSRRTELETYIAQGRAMKKLLSSTNSHGNHDRRIQRLSDKIARAQRSLAKTK